MVNFPAERLCSPGRWSSWDRARMDVRCERCKAEYHVDDERVTETGVTLRCTQCQHLFLVKKKSVVVTVPVKPAPEVVPPPGAEPPASGACARPEAAPSPSGSSPRCRSGSSSGRWGATTRFRRMGSGGGGWGHRRAGEFLPGGGGGAAGRGPSAAATPSAAALSGRGAAGRGAPGPAGLSRCLQSGGPSTPAQGQGAAGVRTGSVAIGAAGLARLLATPAAA
jgi:predicted Zn finger-like uncharacterized protein